MYDLMPLADVAKALCISPRTAKSFLAAHGIPAIEICTGAKKLPRYPKDEVEALLRSLYADKKAALDTPPPKRRKYRPKPKVKSVDVLSMSIDDIHRLIAPNQQALQ